MANKEQVPSPFSSHPSGSRVPSRSHVHSSSMGSIQQARINRRKSSSSHHATASVVAAVNIALGNNNLASNSARRLGKPHSKSPFPSSLPATSGFEHPVFDSSNTSALTDGPALSTLMEATKGSSSSRRARRASEGSRKLEGRDKGKVVDGKGAPGDLKCDKCGKGYKHSSCLSKHLWEHRPEWQITSKLLISKHQQVQLLEAAAVLLSMQKEPSSADSETAVDSDISSPLVSGSDTQVDRASSSEQSPTPDPKPLSSPRTDSKRFSSNSSVYSQSYQSSIFSDMGGPSNGQRLFASHHYRQWSNSDAARPTTSGTSVAASYTESDEHADLAAAVNLLSCSVPHQSTPVNLQSAPMMMLDDVPPVPPLPSKYLGQRADHLSGSTIRGESYIRARRMPLQGHAEDVEMIDDHDDYESEHERVGRSDEEEEGMFGRMEE